MCLLFYICIYISIHYIEVSTGALQWCWDSFKYRTLISHPMPLSNFFEIRGDCKFSPAFLLPEIFQPQLFTKNWTYILEIVDHRLSWPFLEISLPSKLFIPFFPFLEHHPLGKTSPRPSLNVPYMIYSSCKFVIEQNSMMNRC